MKPLARILRIGNPLAGRLLIALLAGIVGAGAAIGLIATSAWLISRAAEQPPVLDLMVAITAVRAFAITRGALRYAERLAAHDAAFRVLGRLRGHAYARLEALAPAGLAAFRSGDLLARLVADVDGLADLWLRVLLPYGVAGIAGLVATLAIAGLVPGAGLALGVTLVVTAVIVPLVAVTLARRAGRQIAQARGDLAAETLDVLQGAPELLVTGALSDRMLALNGRDRLLREAEERTAASVGVGSLLATLSSGAAVWLGLLAGIAAVRSGQLGGVALAVVALTPIAVHEAVSAVVPAAAHVPALAAMARRVTAVLEQPDPVAEPAASAPLPAGPYGVRARDLRARYRHDGPDAMVMPDVDLRAGGRLLVTGPSGSGKSTLAAVLVRFLDASAGTLELVGSDATRNLASLAGDDVRRVVCLCSQDPHVFATTVLENVRLARPTASEAEIRAALEAAQLGPWVASLPDGLGTFVGEHGARLSAGQRQRLALARALLADAGVVIFDEPTEHLDDATAAALTRDLLAATAGRTVIMITHRPELIAAAGWDARIDLGGQAVAPEAA